jgi:hypothetical protein
MEKINKTAVEMNLDETILTEVCRPTFSSGADRVPTTSLKIIIFIFTATF